MSVADEVKGERLVLITNDPQVDLKAVRERLRTRGFSDLAVPRDMKFMRELPKLGTGKTDYVKLKELISV